MTREEAIEELTNALDYIEWSGDKSCVLSKETIELAISALSTEGEYIKKGEWIPVSERLPDKNIAVLTYIDTGMTKTYCLAYWNDRLKGWEEWIGFRMLETEMGYKVLAWQPLPEPYKENDTWN